MCLYKNIILVSITILCTFQKTVAYIHTICKHCCETCVYVRVCVKILNKSSVNFVLLRHSEVKSFSRVRLFATPWTVAHQAPLSMGFSRQEYWSGLPFPSPGHLPDPGIKPRSPSLWADALTSQPQGWSIVKKCCLLFLGKFVFIYFISQAKFGA